MIKTMNQMLIFVFLIDKVSKDHEDFTSFAIGNDMYEFTKQRS